jgi:hypothetical protein
VASVASVFTEPLLNLADSANVFEGRLSSKSQTRVQDRGSLLVHPVRLKIVLHSLVGRCAVT